MGKTANCIKMLELLNTRKIYKVSQLAEILETNPRNIVEYKKELEECGFYINSIPGRYGGYQIDDAAILPTLKLLKEEKEVILEAYNFLLNKPDFLKKDLLSQAVGKIATSIELPNTEQKMLIGSGYHLSMDELEIVKRYEFIENAIKLKRVVEIEYHSLKNGLKTHTIHPYKLFIYNNAWFFLAWHPQVGDVWSFKINRIEKMKLLPDKFRVWKNFKPENYFDGDGFKNNGEYYQIIYLAKNAHLHLAKERVYGKNQTIEEYDDDTIKVSVTMQNKESIISYFMGCGVNVKVLEPLWLIEELVTKAKEITQEYTND